MRLWQWIYIQVLRHEEDCSTNSLADGMSGASSTMGMDSDGRVGRCCDGPLVFHFFRMICLMKEEMSVYVVVVRDKIFALIIILTFYPLMRVVDCRVGLS